MKTEMIDKITGRTIWANKAQEKLLIKIGRAELVTRDMEIESEDEDEGSKKTRKKSGTYKTRALKAEK